MRAIPPGQVVPSLDVLAGDAGRTAFLAGVGGCGLRGIADFLLAAGWQVWGSDRNAFASNDPLVRAGLHVLPDGATPPPVSLCVRSAAVPAEQSGFQAACAAGARPLLYAEMLGEISKLRPVLAIAGSHGKTTTTAWLAWALREAGIEVGYLVGAGIPQLGRSADWGDPSLPLLLESCEYARSFHHLRPARVALLNVDAEHPDTYPGGLSEVMEAFAHFLGQVRADGWIDAGPEAPASLAKETSAEWRSARSIPGDWELGLPGDHNRRNAAVVAAVLRSFGLDEAQVRAGLVGFRGAARRLEEVGQFQGATLVSDYAHHPVEVAATLQAARERWSDARVHAVFQPHQAQRFHAYREQFAPSLDDADALVLLEIYRARDPEELQASVAELAPELRERLPGRPLCLARDFDAAARALTEEVRAGDVVLFLGAGDVDRFARHLR
ncbi:MAG: Mur ligase domain-containing protein [Planctomycetes bacterium]|nr:Mur ligase domain-containing protein [Planctomycetota bacterium]